MHLGIYIVSAAIFKNGLVKFSTEKSLTNYLNVENVSFVRDTSSNIRLALLIIIPIPLKKWSIQSVSGVSIRGASMQ